jgi:hypothetical protein
MLFTMGLDVGQAYQALCECCHNEMCHSSLLSHSLSPSPFPSHWPYGHLAESEVPIGVVWCVEHCSVLIGQLINGPHTHTNGTKQTTTNHPNSSAMKDLHTNTQTTRLLSLAQQTLQIFHRLQLQTKLQNVELSKCFNSSLLYIKCVIGWLIVQ